MSGTNEPVFKPSMKARYVDNGGFQFTGFRQTAFIRHHTPSGTVPSAPPPSTAVVDVSGGVCRELVRMWVWARNFPIASAGLGRAATREVQGQTDEEGLLKKNFNTIMAAQMMVATGRANYTMAEVAGMSANVTECVSVDDLCTRISKPGGTLAYAGVSMPGGNHAIAFDTLGGGFILFDPNTGTWRRLDARVTVSEFVTAYFDVYGYRPLRLALYSKST